MKLANESAEIASRVLHKCCDEVVPTGPWRWLCALQNGARFPVAATYGEGFLHLACQLGEMQESACTPEDALIGNILLDGGVKFALDEASSCLRLQTDIAVLDEKQLLDRFWWALDGFHDGRRLLKSPASRPNFEIEEPADSGADLRELLRETSWTVTERGPNESSVELDKASAAKANIRMSKRGTVLNLELIRMNALAETASRALAVFLLTASGGLRLVRAYGAMSCEEKTFGMQVCLPTNPATEEIDHALAALAIAHRRCAKETRVLLDDGAARCYLAARTTSTTDDKQEEKEN